MDQSPELASEPATASSSSRPQRRQLSLVRIILFGLAGPPMQLTGNVAAFYFSIYLLEVAKLTPPLVSAINFSGRLWDAVTDPAVGQLLSRTRPTGRFGKTRLWILFSGIAGSVVFFLMWLPLPEVESEGAKFAYYLILHLAYCTAITCYHIPYTSSTVLLSELSSDRDAATAARIACDLIFTIVGSGAFGYVIGTKRIAIDCGNFSGTTSDANLTLTDGTMTQRILEEQNSYKLAAGLISLAFLCSAIIGFFGIKESVNLVATRETNVLRNIYSVLKFRPYLAVMMSFLFMSLGIQIIQANLGLFTTHRLKIGWHMTFGFMSILVVATLFIPVLHFLNGKIGKKKNFLIGVMIGFPCIMLTLLMEPHDLVLYYIVTCASGIMISVAMLQPWSMLPDVIEAYYRTFGNSSGDRKEAIFYSLYAFFTKFATGVSLGVSQLALWIGRYDSGSCQQPESVSVTLRWLIAPGPSACFLVSASIMLLAYPSDKRLFSMGISAPNEVDLHQTQSNSELHGDAVVEMQTLLNSEAGKSRQMEVT